jgi:AcrR family transcriptional regulator
MAAAADPPELQRFTAKGRATRERILGSAAQVLLSQGLSGFNMESVRQQASVSGSQLTHYFAGKPELIRAILDRQIDLVLDFHRQPSLGDLQKFDDFERWIDLNIRYLRKIGYTKTPTYHTLVGQLAKSDDATRQTLADGYRRWVDLFEHALQRMKDRGVLLTSADPRHLALVLVGGHQGAGTLTFAYRQEWPLADATRFAVNYLRTFAADPAERIARKPRRPRERRTRHAGPPIAESGPRFTRKGLATRARIVGEAAELVFQRGVSGTSLEDVRTAVNVSGSQLSHYFADKRDLTRQVIALRINDVMDVHTRPQLGHLDNLQALREWADACIADTPTVYLRGGCVYGSLAGELLEADEGVLDDLAAGYDRWLRLFRDGLTAMRRRGDLAEDADPRHLAVALVAAHQGGTMLAHATGTAEPLAALVNAAVAYVASFRPARGTRASRSARRSPKKG